MAIDKECRACPAALACVTKVVGPRLPRCEECKRGEVVINNPGHKFVLVSTVRVSRDCPKLVNDMYHDYKCDECLGVEHSGSREVPITHRHVSLRDIIGPRRK